MRLPRTKRTRLAVALSAVLLIAAAIAIGVATSAQPPESGPAVDSHSEHADIWVVDVQTRELRQATLNADALEPSWSPDGEIAFSTQSCDECLSEIHVDGAGSTEVPVDTTVRHLFQPSWAPDGHRVAVVRLGHGIWVADDRTRTATRLTYGPSDEAPAWSPGGEWIAFDKLVRNTNYELFAVNAVTGELRRLTRDPEAQTQPSLVSRRLPPGVRRAAVEREVGDLHDGLRRQRAQAGHRQPDQRPGALLVAGRQEDRVHPAGARSRDGGDDRRGRHGKRRRG